MAIGNFIMQLFILITIRDLISIFTFKESSDTSRAKRLDELRNKHHKTLDEQKEFIRLKENNKPFNIKAFVFNTIYFLAGFFTLRYAFEQFQINLSVLIACLIVIPFGIMISYMLFKMKLKENNLFEILGGKRR